MSSKIINSSNSEEKDLEQELWVDIEDIPPPENTSYDDEIKGTGNQKAHEDGNLILHYEVKKQDINQFISYWCYINGKIEKGQKIPGRVIKKYFSLMQQSNSIKQTLWIAEAVKLSNKIFPSLLKLEEANNSKETSYLIDHTCEMKHYHPTEFDSLLIKHKLIPTNFKHESIYPSGFYKFSTETLLFYVCIRLSVKYSKITQEDKKGDLKRILLNEIFDSIYKYLQKTKYDKSKMGYHKMAVLSGHILNQFGFAVTTKNQQKAEDIFQGVKNQLKEKKALFSE